LLIVIEDNRLHTEEVQHILGLVNDNFKPQNLLDTALNTFRQFSNAGMATIILANVKIS
jgi:hypothetical protein